MGATSHSARVFDAAAGEASLSPEKDATLVPEVLYFTVRFPTGSHRSRAYKRESSIGLPNPGCPGRDHKVHGKTRHFCHFVPFIFDTIANSTEKLPNGTREHTKRQRHAWYF